MKKVPDIIKTARRNLRDNQTEAEIKFWNEVRAKRQLYKFQRQFPIFVFTENTGHDRYIIADFYCSELRLIFELDGDVHNRKDIYELDRIKEELLKKQGFEIIRLKNNQVIEHPNLKKYVGNILQPLALVKSKDSGKSLGPVDSKKEDINSDMSLGPVDSKKEDKDSDMSLGPVDSKKFIMINTSFTCESCNFEVPKHPTGSARNHCPNCLYSKHLDKDFPGDRASTCGGLMKVVGLDYKKNKGLMLKHTCTKCDKTILNKIAEDDNQELIRNL